MGTQSPSLRITALLALASMTLAGCTREAPTASTESVQLAVVAGADHGGRPFRTDLTQEVTSQPVWTGDPDGTGTALITINLGQGEVCWETSVTDVTLPATASHIHMAAPDIRGPIVIALTPPDATGIAVGCKDGVSRELLQDILLHPEAFYVNVHTADFPAGAIRGQLAE